MATNATIIQQKPPFSREVARGLEVPNASLSPEEVERLKQVQAQKRDEIRANTHNDWNYFYETKVVSSPLAPEIKQVESITTTDRLKIGDRTELLPHFNTRQPETFTGLSSFVSQKEVIEKFEASRIQPEAVVTEPAQPIAQTVSRPKLSFPGSGILDGIEKGWKKIKKWGSDTKDALVSWLQQDVLFPSKPAKKETPEQKKEKEEKAKKSQMDRGFIENLRQLISGARRREAAIASKRAELEQMNRDKHASNISAIEDKLDLNDYTKISIHEQAEWDKNKTESAEEQLNKKRKAQVAASGASKKPKGLQNHRQILIDQNRASENPSNIKTALQ